MAARHYRIRDSRRRFGPPRAFESTRYELSDSVTATTGSHRIRAGFDWNVNDVQQSREDNIQGRYDYKSLSDFVAGKISRYRQTVLTFSPTTRSQRTAARDRRLPAGQDLDRRQRHRDGRRAMGRTVESSADQAESGDP